MGKRAIRVLCELSIFSFFVLFIKMSSVASVTPNIIDIIKSDPTLQCKLPPNVYNNSIIKGCYNLKYPENITQITNRNTILCIVFYDMLHKVCSSNVASQIPNDNAKFKSYIDKFFPENELQRDRFCENIKSVKFSYNKLLPLLSSTHFNESSACYPMCFNWTQNFNPHCAVLAWSKRIDEDIKNLNKSHQIQSQSSALANGVQQSKIFSSTKSTDDEQIKQSIVKVPLVNSLQTSSRANANDNPGVEPQAADTKPDVVSESQSKIPENSVKAPNNQATSSKNQDKITENQSNTLENQDKIAEDPDKAPENKGNPPENKGNPSENKDNPPENENVLLENQGNAPENEANMSENEGSAPENQGNAPENNINDDEKNKKDAIDIKTDTISENTQNHENSLSQNELMRLEDDKPSYDTNDVSNHAVDTAIMPEPEQRNIISRYSSIKSGERSHFFTYFTVFSLISIAAYVGYHNKQKILAMVLEGRRSRSNRGRRRPSTANYRKLDCTLEEAVTSQCNANVTHVIY